LSPLKRGSLLRAAHLSVVLKDDKRAIFATASHPQRAAEFLHGLQATAPAQANAI
jgi:antirestriction protein ArdC